MMSFNVVRTYRRGVGEGLGRSPPDADVVAPHAARRALAALLPLHAPGLRGVRVRVEDAPEQKNIKTQFKHIYQKN